MSKVKIGKNQANMLMSLIVILVLLIPAYATYSIDENKQSQVMAVEGLYENGTIGLIVEPANETYIDRFCTSYNELDPAANNDSVLIGMNQSGSPRYVAQLQNALTYTGGGNYTVSVNWSAIPDAWISRGRALFIEFNITNSEIASYDWVKVYAELNTTVEVNLHTFPGTNHYMTPVRAGEWILPISLAEISDLQANPNLHPALQLGSQWTEQFDDNPTFTLRMEFFNFEEGNAPMFTDETLYIMSLILSDAIFVVAIVFTTNFIDVKLDRRRK